MDSLPINILDIAVGGVLLISAVFAFARGLVHEVLAVIGWIGAIFATIYGFPYAKPYARGLIGMPLIADLAAGAVIFIVTLVLLSILTRAISKRVQDSALGTLDRSLGFLFGLLRGAVLVCLAYIGYELVVPNRAEHPTWLTSARSLPLIVAGADTMVALLPETAARIGIRRPAPAQPGQATGGAEAPKALQDLLKPQPKGAGTPAREGYGEKERQDMERLIDSTSQ